MTLRLAHRAGQSLIAIALLAAPALLEAQPAPLNTALSAGRCVDVPGGTREPGTQLVLWDCNGAENQRFDFRSGGEIRVYGAMCLDAAGGGGRDGDRIVIWACHGGANQRWALNSAGQLQGINGKCIDVAGGSSGNGAQLVLWSCHGGANQRWSRDLIGGKYANVVEYCFGAVGSKCDGAPNATALRMTDGRVYMYASVGSILHDNCCLANPGGKMCSGPASEFQHNGRCVAEWDKAFWNTLRDNRQWRVTLAGNRRSALGVVAGRSSRLANGTVITQFETTATRALAAPKGTALDPGDQQFCASGRAVERSNGLVKWIECL